MKIPFLDIPRENNSIWPELEEALGPVLSEAQFILGPAVERFEESFADYIGTRHCVGLNSGTSALHMALCACDIGPGDEVITTSHTWISTSWAVSYVGATPVFVDIDPKTYNIDEKRVIEAITSRTKAILPVHLYGNACEMKKLVSVARDNGLWLIEDAAQAHGASLVGRRVGSLGDVGCFSFYPGKNLGAFGEGGAIVTDNEMLAERVRRLRDHAQSGRHNHVELGYNTRMEGIQGAVLDVKLRHIDSWNERRRRHAKRYLDLLCDAPSLQLPTAQDILSHVWHLFVVLVRGVSRDRLQEQLADRGIFTGIHYPVPVPLQPVYSHLGYTQGDFPVAEDVTRSCLSLPIYPEITEQEIDHVCRTLNQLIQREL